MENCQVPLASCLIIQEGEIKKIIKYRNVGKTTLARIRKKKKNICVYVCMYKIYYDHASHALASHLFFIHESCVCTCQDVHTVKSMQITLNNPHDIFNLKKKKKKFIL